MNLRPTRRLTRVAAFGVTAAAALVLSATPALAAPSGKIIQITQQSDGALQIVLSADGLAPGQVLDPKTVSASIEGTDVPGVTAVRNDGATVSFDQTAVIVMDTSASMKTGNNIGHAKAAAGAYLSALPADVKVGLVTFSDKVRVQVTPTRDRARLRSALAAVQAAGGTALYDGVIEGVRVAGAKGARSIILLSDGGDTTSRARIAAAALAVDKSKVSMAAVALGTGSNPGVLRALVRPAGGQVIPAGNAASLTKAFVAAAAEISNRLIVTVPIPKNLAFTSGNVRVSAKAGDAFVSDASFATFSTRGSAATADPNAFAPKDVVVTKPLVGDSTLPLALGALFLGLVVILVVALTSVSRKDSKEGRVRRRLSIYTLTGRAPVKQQETTALGDSNVARSAVEFAGRVVARRDFEEVLGLRLEAAGVPLRSAEWLLIHVGLTLGMGLLFLLLFGGALVPALIGVAIGFLAPWFYLSFKETRRLNAFLGQLPDTLQLLSGSLSAGYSLPQAVDTVVREGQPPIVTEFNRALVEARLGVPLEDALDSVAARMKSKDFAWVVMAVRIQREVGGNLAEVLTTVAATLRERERLRRQVLVLSAEGRLSAWILGGLPIVFGTYLALVRREYLRPLYTELLGYILLGMGLTFLTVGILWLRKVVKVEV